MCESGCQDNGDDHQNTDNDEWKPCLQESTKTGESGGGGRDQGKEGEIERGSGEEEKRDQEKQEEGRDGEEEEEERDRKNKRKEGIRKRSGGGG